MCLTESKMKWLGDVYGFTNFWPYLHVLAYNNMLVLTMTLVSMQLMMLSLAWSFQEELLYSISWCQTLKKQSFPAFIWKSNLSCPGSVKRIIRGLIRGHNASSSGGFGVWTDFLWDVEHRPAPWLWICIFNVVWLLSVITLWHYFSPTSHRNATMPEKQCSFGKLGS